MSHDVDVFVAGAADLGELAERAARALDMAFERFERDGVSVFQSLDSQRDVLLLEHDLIDDGALQFSHFPYQATVRMLGVAAEDREAADRHLALWVLERFAQAGLGPAMAVEGLQTLLARTGQRGLDH